MESRRRYRGCRRARVAPTEEERAGKVEQIGADAIIKGAQQDERSGLAF